MEFWRRHRRKIFVSCGVLGGGYFLYKLYGAHKQRLAEIESELANEHEKDEIIKRQLLEHFTNIQRIADSTTLPHTIQLLHTRLMNIVDLTGLRDRLLQVKGQSGGKTTLEKLELWERLKIQSFTGILLSLWALTTLSLYVRVQVNILGRHLYIDTARGLGSFLPVDEGNAVESHDQKQFLESIDFLSLSGLSALVTKVQAAVTEIMKGKQLRDHFTPQVLREIFLQISETFMSSGTPHEWIDFLMPVEVGFSDLATTRTSSQMIQDETKFNQLMMETRAVLSSAEFRDILEVSLKTVISSLVEDTNQQVPQLSSGIPLAKLLPRVAQMGPTLLMETSRDRYINIIYKIPDVEFFFTQLYANMPVL
uniref:Peroxin-3 n=1 Tax=Kalanchoe fedtschenkoi TaxID=63787 RepID=A0A7N0UGL8_KALFE